MTKRELTESDSWAVGWMIRALVVIAFFAAFTVPIKGANGEFWVPIMAVATGAENEASEDVEPIVISLRTPVPTATPQLFTPTPHIPHVGIIAGHTGSDSGAICPDGLQEVDVNANIARRVVSLLTDHGWQVDLLEEFDVRLNGYQADALLSIHADSCNVPGKSGFKIVRAESSYLSGPEDNLVDCISRHYAEQTGLEFDPHTITYDMTRYHAYYEIDRETPAAVIEAGFMLDDRELLTQRSDLVARGIVEGLICFVEGETP